MEHKRLPRTDGSQVQAKGTAEKPKRVGKSYVKSFRFRNEHFIIAVLRQQRYGVQRSLYGKWQVPEPLP